MKTLSDLPPEIILQIASYVYTDSTPINATENLWYTDSLIPRSSKLLLNFALSSKHVYSVLLPILWNSVHLEKPLRGSSAASSSSTYNRSKNSTSFRVPSSFVETPLYFPIPSVSLFHESHPEHSSGPVSKFTSDLTFCNVNAHSYTYCDSVNTYANSTASLSKSNYINSGLNLPVRTVRNSLSTHILQNVSVFSACRSQALSLKKETPIPFVTWYQLLDPEIMPQLKKIEICIGSSSVNNTLSTFQKYAEQYLLDAILVKYPEYYNSLSRYHRSSSLKDYPVKLGIRINLDCLTNLELLTDKGIQLIQSLTIVSHINLNKRNVKTDLKSSLGHIFGNLISLQHLAFESTRKKVTDSASSMVRWDQASIAEKSAHPESISMLFIDFLKHICSINKKGETHPDENQVVGNCLITDSINISTFHNITSLELPSWIEFKAVLPESFFRNSKLQQLICDSNHLFDLFSSYCTLYQSQPHSSYLQTVSSIYPIISTLQSLEISYSPTYYAFRNIEGFIPVVTFLRDVLPPFKSLSRLLFHSFSALWAKFMILKHISTLLVLKLNVIFVDDLEFILDSPQAQNQLRMLHIQSISFLSSPNSNTDQLDNISHTRITKRFIIKLLGKFQNLKSLVKLVLPAGTSPIFLGNMADQLEVGLNYCTVENYNSNIYSGSLWSFNMIQENIVLPCKQLKYLWFDSPIYFKNSNLYQLFPSDQMVNHMINRLQNEVYMRTENLNNPNQGDETPPEFEELLRYSAQAFFDIPELAHIFRSMHPNEQDLDSFPLLYRQQHVSFGRSRMALYQHMASRYVNFTRSKSGPCASLAQHDVKMRHLTRVNYPMDFLPLPLMDIAYDQRLISFVEPYNLYSYVYICDLQTWRKDIESDYFSNMAKEMTKGLVK